MATPTFICGAECGINAVGASGLTPHWNLVSGTVTVDTTIFHYGIASYKASTAATANYLGKDLAQNRTIGSVALYFTSLSSGTGYRSLFRTLCGANHMTIGYDENTGNFYALVTGSTPVQGSAASTGSWFVFDFDFNSSGATRTIDWKINGVAQTQASYAVAAANQTRFDIGDPSGVLNMNFDDIIWSVTAADYPLGEVKVLGFSPNASGSHSFNAGDFQDRDGNNITLPSGIVHTFLDEVPITSTADYIKQVVINANGYIRFDFADTSETADALGLSIVSSQHSAGTAANQATFYIDDGGTLNLIYFGDISQISIIYNFKVYATAPSTGAWTQAKINALAARWGYSSDVIGNPYLDGAILEVAWAVPVAITAYKDIPTRFRLWVQAFKDIATRFRLIVQAFKDIGTRFLLTVQNYKDVSTRFQLWGQSYRDIATRFRLTIGIPAWKDIATRFLLTAQSYKDIATRFQLWAQNYKDAATRFTLTVQAYTDIGTRFRLIAQAYRDIATRFRLAVQGYRDVPTRFRLVGSGYRDIGTRFRLIVQAYVDIATRFLLQVQGFRDIGTQFRLIAPGYRDIATRFILSILTYRDIATRFRLAIQGFRDVGTRFRLVVRAYFDVASRYRLIVGGYGDAGVRFRVRAIGAFPIIGGSHIIDTIGE